MHVGFPYVKNRMWFSPVNLSHVNLIVRPARRILKDRGNFSSPTVPIIIHIYVKHYCRNLDSSFSLDFLQVDIDATDKSGDEK